MKALTIEKSNNEQQVIIYLSGTIVRNEVKMHGIAMPWPLSPRGSKLNNLFGFVAIDLALRK